jgi:hypothetical protein
VYSNLDNYVDNILTTELNGDTSNKLINRIDKDINFKYNSFNICIGKQSTGKTTGMKFCSEYFAQFFCINELMVHYFAFIQIIVINLFLCCLYVFKYFRPCYCT